MQIWIADDNRKRAGALLKKTVECGQAKKELKKLSSPNKVISQLKKSSCDVLFVGIDRPQFDWVSVVANVCRECPLCNVIFVSDDGDGLDPVSYRSYRISGYIHTPITQEKVEEELTHLRYAPCTSH